MFLKYGLRFLFLLMPVCAFSQWDNGQVSVFFSMPEVALVDIEPGVNNRIHFTLSASTESGSQPVIEESADETLWINYSSALAGQQGSRSVTAELSQGALPEGLRLYLEASDYTGGGDGQVGQPAGKIELSNQPRPVITGIGNCYTGDGIQNGHRLTFSIEIFDYANMAAAGQFNFVVLYTLTDN
ncbi:hypothetical protein [Mariniphaga sediminis]|uniref:hypothetical protein n=1 Tax=Mariniphaga sediminis TaxID=1628158 RepID=UPI0035645065